MPDTSGKETHLRYLHLWSERHVCRAGPLTDRLLGIFHICYQGCQDTNQETQKGGVHHFQGITEAGSRPLLRQPSSTHQRAALHHTDLPWHWPRDALPSVLHWTEDIRVPLTRRWWLSWPPCCLLDLQTKILGLSFVIPHWLLRVCYIFLRLLEHE